MAEPTDTQETLDKTDAPEVTSQTQAPDFEKAFKDFQDEVRGKLTQVGKDLGRVRGKVKEKNQEPEEPKTSVSRDDIDAARKLGRIQATLPEEISAEIDELLDNGGSYSDALKMADMAKKIMSKVPANEDQNKSQANPRRQAPNRTRPERPRSVKDFMDLQKKARGGDKAAKERYDALMDDDNFDLSALPQYSFQAH